MSWQDSQASPNSPRSVTAPAAGFAGRHRSPTGGRPNAGRAPAAEQPAPGARLAADPRGLPRSTGSAKTHTRAWAPVAAL